MILTLLKADILSLQPGVVDVRATEGQQESSGESKRDDPLEREVAANGRQARPKRFQVKAQKRADAEDGWGIQREKSGRRGVGHGDFGATRQDLGEQPFG